MAGFISTGNNIFLSAAVAAGQSVRDGQFVDLTFGADGVTTAVPCAATPAVAPYFVACEDDTTDEQGISTVDIVHQAGALIKVKKLLPGEGIVSTEAADGIQVGDTVYAGDGVLNKAASGDYAQTFAVVEAYSYGGKTAYRCHALD